MCGEACHHDDNDTKVKNDNSKLIREGKKIQRILAHIFYNGDNHIDYIWMVQVKGTQCIFSTCHPTSYHYRVWGMDEQTHFVVSDEHVIPIRNISFPASYSLMDERNCNFIRPLLAFRTSIENLAVEVETSCPPNDWQRETNRSPWNLHGLHLPEKIV